MLYNSTSNAFVTFFGWFQRQKRTISKYFCKLKNCKRGSIFKSSTNFRKNSWKMTNQQNSYQWHQQHANILYRCVSFNVCTSFVACTRSFHSTSKREKLEHIDGKTIHRLLDVWYTSEVQELWVVIMGVLWCLIHDRWALVELDDARGNHFTLWPEGRRFFYVPIFAMLSHFNGHKRAILAEILWFGRGLKREEKL